MAACCRGLFGRSGGGPAGVYLWGGVGRGKSMLMDLAFAHIDVHPKRRVHFNEFMLEVHARLRKARESEDGDPIEPVADAIAAEAKLLCFDEMQVTNPADAMILSRLFGKLLAEGVKVVTTSNRPPSDLYKDGLNRELFLPFIALIEKSMLVVAVDGPDRLPARPARGGRGVARAERTRSHRRACPGFLPADRLSGRGSRQGSVRGAGCRRRADAPCAQEPQGSRGLFLQAAVRGSRAAPRTISPSRGAIIP